MLICPKCNHQVPDDAKYCEFCGVRFLPVEEGSETAESQATTVLTSDMKTGFYANDNQYQQDFSKEFQPQATPYANQNFQYQSNQNMNQRPMYSQAPVSQLKTDRSFIKTLLLSMITFGIYALITYGSITDDVNLVCSKYDGKKSMNYFLLIFIVTPLTFGIASLVWFNNICQRIGNELKRRQIAYEFGSKDFWLWGILGSIIIVGPFVFAHKFFTAVNMMNEDYNIKG